MNPAFLGSLDSQRIAGKRLFSAWKKRLKCVNIVLP